MNRLPPDKEFKAILMLRDGQSQRFVAKELGIHKNTAWKLQLKVKEAGPIFCPCGKAAGHKEWCGHRIANSPKRTAYYASCFRRIETISFYIPSRPRYERPDIPDEFKTEIKLLVNSRRVSSLDASLFFGDENGHSVFSSNVLDPLQELMKKEHEESFEFRDRERRVEEFLRWRYGKDRLNEMAEAFQKAKALVK